MTFHPFLPSVCCECGHTLGVIECHVSRELTASMILNRYPGYCQFLYCAHCSQAEDIEAEPITYSTIHWTYPSP